jgi:hypothetical protein
MIKHLITVLSVCLLFSCAGKQKYTPPLSTPPLKNSITINKGKAEVWKAIVPALGKSFFVINNLDKESGIINVSYTGDPENYVDCGRIYSYVSNVRGKRIYDFPASRAHQRYEIMTDGLFSIDRKMNLEGRINIIIEEIQSDKTLITVNTKYVLTKSGTVQNVQGTYRNFSDTISFVSGQQGRFPGDRSHSGTVCQPDGSLEQQVLSIFSSAQK